MPKSSQESHEPSSDHSIQFESRMFQYFSIFYNQKYCASSQVDCAHNKVSCFIPLSQHLKYCFSQPFTKIPSQLIHLHSIDICLPTIYFSCFSILPDLFPKYTQFSSQMPKSSQESHESSSDNSIQIEYRKPQFISRFHNPNTPFLHQLSVLTIRYPVPFSFLKI
jgi:hypothetical protein